MNLRHILCVSLLALLMAHAANATTRKVLFIGNSYTYTNGMMGMLQSFATASGDILYYDYWAPGGYTFQQHSVDATTISKINAQDWDVVVLQEQSQMPAFPPAQVTTDVYPYASRIDSFVYENDTCTETMFMMTWGRKFGDVDNCPTYSVVCTYEGMQQRLRQSYLQMGTTNRASVTPVGAAWKVARDSFPGIELYQPDSSHPSVAGTYLQVCVLYSSIFHKKASGCSYLGGVSASDAQALQHIADEVSYDSIAYWQQHGHYPTASFTHTNGAHSSVTFTSHAPLADSFYWSFGDGTHATVPNPSHVFSTTGTFTVTVGAVTDCFIEYFKDTVHVVSHVGVDDVSSALHEPLITISQGGNGHVSFLLPANSGYDMLELYDSKGSMVRKYPLHNEPRMTDDLPPGLYIYRAYSKDRTVSEHGKLSVY